MALNNLGLGFVFTARDLASRSFDRISSRFSSLTQNLGLGSERAVSALKQLKVGIGLLAGGGVLLAGAFAAANQAADFEQGLAAVGAVSRATTADLASLREAAIQAGVETQFSPDEAVAGLQSLATAGQTATQATRTLIPVLDLAAGSMGQLGVAGAADAVVGTLNAYGMSADNAADVTDRLLRITQLTNFQTRDFEGGLAKAAAAGATFDQSLNDVLVTMGLLRNRNIDASSSSTAVREAIRRLGSDMRAQQEVAKAGVTIFDEQTGKMRSIVDITLDLADATATMRDEERNAIVARSFGARGLLAFNAIQKATSTVVRDGAEVMLQGRDAVAALRGELSRAEGTAGGFRSALADTFKGQKTLLAGTLQTLAIVIGEPFAQVLKPVVLAVVSAFNVLLQVVKNTPGPVKRFLAGLVAVAGALAAGIGAVLALKGAIVLGGLALKALGLTMAGIGIVAAKVVAVFALIGLAAWGLYTAFKRNFGGIATFFRATWDKIRLIFDAIVQVFRDGGFSGAVQKELSKAENNGIKRFVISLFRFGDRVKRFFVGIAEGFQEIAGPAFEELGGAFRELFAVLSDIGAEVSAAFGGVAEGAADLLPAGRNVQSAGAMIGMMLSMVLKAGVKVVTWIVRFGTTAARVVRHVVGFFRELVDTALEMGRKVVGVFRTMRDRGATLFESLAAAARAYTQPVVDVFVGMADGIMLALTKLQDFLIAAVRKIPDWALPERLEKLKTLKTSDEAAQAAASNAAFASLPAAVQAEVTANVRRADNPLEAIAAMQRTLAEFVAAQKEGREIVVQIDGEAIARANERQRASAAARGFATVPVL